MVLGSSVGFPMRKYPAGLAEGLSAVILLIDDRGI